MRYSRGSERAVVSERISGSLRGLSAGFTGNTEGVFGGFEGFNMRYRWSKGVSEDFGSVTWAVLGVWWYIMYEGVKGASEGIIGGFSRFRRRYNT